MKKTEQINLRAFLVLLTFVVSTIQALSQLPTGFVVNQLTTNSINEAVAMGHAPDGRIFIAERSGALKVYTNGTVSVVHTVQTTTAVEQGLLGLALHNDFNTNGKCYLYYTNTTATRHYLDVLIIGADNSVASVTRIMEFDPIINGFHNGGAMLFKNNYLYLCIGESNSPAQSANLDTYFGKVLRLLDNGDPAPGNPYYDAEGASRQRRSIWAIGMRNPWYMSMDPSTGKIYVVDVGGNYEEINDVTTPDPTKNYNYGWAGNGQSGSEQPATTIHGTFYYPHNGWGCAITSGVAFNPTGTSAYPTEYRGRFFFTDWCSGWLRSFDMNNPANPHHVFSGTGFGNVLGLSLGLDGNIYFFKYGTNGSLNRIEYTLPTTPGIVNHPQSQTVVSSEPVTFSVTASGATPLTYQWYKNDVAIPNTNAATYTIASTDATSAGTYYCIVSNSFGNVTSNNATLTVQPFNARPLATILTPSSTLTWNVGDVISFSGSATDLEDGTLPVSAYQWEVRLFHRDCPTCEHWHPGPAAPSGVTTGTFTVDNGGETSSNIWVRLILTVTDSQGRTGKDSVDLHPNKVNLTVESNKPGIQLSLGGSNVSPFVKTGVVYSSLTLSAPSPQIIGDSIYTFVSWNIGGAATQSIQIPATNATYRAIYTATYTGQTPFGGTPHPVPGIVEAEDFDEGGEGKAYHDKSAGNAGNSYRTDEDVDIQPCNEGGYNIAYVDAGEWLEYTLDVQNTGIYTVSVRVATPYNDKTILLSIDDSPISGSIAVPNTGGFQNWQTASVENISLTAGLRTLRVTMETNNFNLSYIEFELITITNNVPKLSLLNIEAYPNPVKDILVLKSSALFNEPLVLSLLTTRGTTTWTKSISSATLEEQIDISSLPSGMYFLKIITGNRTETLKVIKH